MALSCCRTHFTEAHALSFTRLQKMPISFAHASSASSSRFWRASCSRSRSTRGAALLGGVVVSGATPLATGVAVLFATVVDVPFAAVGAGAGAATGVDGLDAGFGAEAEAGAGGVGPVLRLANFAPTMPRTTTLRTIPAAMPSFFLSASSGAIFSRSAGSFIEGRYYTFTLDAMGSQIMESQS